MMCSRGCGRQAGWSQCVSLVRAACSGCVGSPNRSLQWLTNGSKFMAGLWGAGERSSSRMRTPLNARRLEGLTPRFLESQVLYLPCSKRGKRPKNLARNLYQLSCDDVTIVDMICGMVWPAAQYRRAVYNEHQDSLTKGCTPDGDAASACRGASSTHGSPDWVQYTHRCRAQEQTRSFCKNGLRLCLTVGTSH